MIKAFLFWNGISFYAGNWTKKDFIHN
jgi:hypothetical protein